jgi:magnesium transporter
MRSARLLSREFVRAHPADAAATLERFSVEEASALLAELPPATAAAGLRRMASMAGADCLAGIADRRAAKILGELPPDVATRLLLRLSPRKREDLLAETPAKIAAALRRGLRFRSATAAALVDPEVLSFPDQITAGQALSRLRHSSRHGHCYVYVVDRDERLLGVLTLHELLLAPPKSSLASVMNPQVMRLSATAGRATILAHEGWRQVHALPVVDEAGRFMGVVDHQTARRLQQEDAPVRGPDEAASIGLALADLCWIGMTKILGGLAMAVFREPATRDTAKGGRHGH